jgi:tRNA G18 (ribose-2'-O)-methylase SpoU
MTPTITLVGDSIENPGNALTMLHAAEMYDVGCCFRDTKDLRESPVLMKELDGRFPVVTDQEVQFKHTRVIAFDNLKGAREVYGFRPGIDFAIVVGNERRGLTRTFREMATDTIEIPMLSRKINTLNVAAASAVALHYLAHVSVGPMRQRSKPNKKRPEILLMGGEDHIELGSAIRSATAFGWQRAFVEDRERIWFGCNRVIRSEGRAAARRGRNSIRLVPCSIEVSHGFPEVIIITTNSLGKPLHRMNLARGVRQLIVIPDESGVDLNEEDWSRLGKNIKFAHLNLPVADFNYHYRLIATIALAEISRQVGRRRPGARKPTRWDPIYDRALELLADTAGEEVWLEDLLDY